VVPAWMGTRYKGREVFWMDKALNFSLQILQLRVCKQSQVYVNEENNSEVSP